MVGLREDGVRDVVQKYVSAQNVDRLGLKNWNPKYLGASSIYGSFYFDQTIIFGTFHLLAGL